MTNTSSPVRQETRRGGRHVMPLLFAGDKERGRRTEALAVAVQSGNGRGTEKNNLTPVAAPCYIF